MISQKIINAIKKRRSVYPVDFTGEKIKKEIVLEILRAANTAPTHKLTQPWFFKIFSSNAKMELANLLKQKIFKKFQLSSHIICICMRRDINKSIPEWEEIAATAMAVQNIWLSCVDSNIGGYWSTPKVINKLNSFLKLNHHERCLGLFYLGMYDSIKKRQLPRKKIEEDIHWYE
jgi:nitroreductase